MKTIKLCVMEGSSMGFILFELAKGDGSDIFNYMISQMNTAFFKLSNANLKKSSGKMFSDIWPDPESGWKKMADTVLTSKKAASFEITSQRNGRHYKMEMFVPGEGLFAVLAENISEQKKVEAEAAIAKKSLLEKYTTGDIVGRSRQMRKILDILPTIARSDCNALISGPSGTGKNLIARAIHNLSERAGRPFYVINCGALPETLLESELFGYVKGAFTDAKADKPGKFELADGGVVLLDEIGDLPFHTQVKLLNFIEHKTFESLGSNKVKKADVRIIAATNCDLGDLIERKLFREDLYYRLKIVNLAIPSLSERTEDIELLIDHFMGRFNQKYSKRIARISSDARDFLLEYDYPGNIRELNNILEHAYIFCDGDTIRMEHFPEECTKKTPGERKSGQQNAERKPSAGRPKKSVPGERERVEAALEKHHSCRNEAARELGINRVQLWRLMKKYGLL